MKFSQLNVGDHFRLDDEIYIKCTPLIANHATSGKPKMVARYLDVARVSQSGPRESAGLSTPIEALDFFVCALGLAIEGSPLSATAKALVAVEVNKAQAETLSRLV